MIKWATPPLTTLIPERGLPRAYRFFETGAAFCLISRFARKHPHAHLRLRPVHHRRRLRGVPRCRFCRQLRRQGRGVRRTGIWAAPASTVGCIPKKLPVLRAHYHEDFADSAGFGWTLGERKFDWATLIGQQGPRDRAPERHLRGASSPGRMSGSARARAPGRPRNTVEIGGKRDDGRSTSWLRRVAGECARGAGHRTTPSPSNEAFHLKELPRRVMIVGAGYYRRGFASHLQRPLGARTKPALPPANT